MTFMKHFSSALLIFITKLPFTVNFWNFCALFFFSPLLMGSFTELANAGDSLSMPIHYGIATLALVIIWMTLKFSVNIGMAILFLYLVFLGWIRRALIPSTGYISNDPITLVSTAVSVIYFVSMVLRHILPQFTIISKNMLILTIIMIFQIFNPFQGGILVGLGGVIFRLTPILWYFVGIKSGLKKNIFNMLILLVIGGAIQTIFGAYQIFVGYSEVEKYWVSAGGGTQYAGKSFRPVGTLLSFSEYVYLLVMPCTVCWVFIISKKYIYIIPFVILLVTTFLSSSRGSIMNICLMIVVTWAIQGKTYRVWFPRLIMAIVMIIWSLLFGLEKIKEVNTIGQSGSGQVSYYIDHQVKGLSDPIGKASTGGSHISLITDGIIAGFRNPIGYGLGSATVASGKFTEEGVAGTEADYSDMFVSLGFVGGIFYLIICTRIWLKFMWYWHVTRDKLALAVIALLVVCQGQWCSGAQYTQSMVLWFVIGCMDKIIWRYENNKKLEALL